MPDQMIKLIAGGVLLVHGLAHGKPSAPRSSTRFRPGTPSGGWLEARSCSSRRLRETRPPRSPTRSGSCRSSGSSSSRCRSGASSSRTPSGGRWPWRPRSFRSPASRCSSARGRCSIPWPPSAWTSRSSWQCSAALAGCGPVAGRTARRRQACGRRLLHPRQAPSDRATASPFDHRQPQQDGVHPGLCNHWRSKDRDRKTATRRSTPRELTATGQTARCCRPSTSRPRRSHRLPRFTRWRVPGARAAPRARPTAAAGRTRTARPGVRMAIAGAAATRFGKRSAGSDVTRASAIARTCTAGRDRLADLTQPQAREQDHDDRQENCSCTPRQTLPIRAGSGDSLPDHAIGSQTAHDNPIASTVKTTAVRVIWRGRTTPFPAGCHCVRSPPASVQAASARRATMPATATARSR